jgi:hypothetical protein
LNHKPLTLIEGNSEIDNECFYEKINHIIEEEREKNACFRIISDDSNDDVKYSS